MEPSSENAAPRFLRRSSEDRVIAGVAGGLARYFGVDPAVVRVVFVLFAVLPPAIGLLLYLVAWVVIPRDDATVAAGTRVTPPTGAIATVVGLVLVALGAVLTVELVAPSWIDGRYIAPALIVLLGVGMLVRGIRD